MQIRFHKISDERHALEIVRTDGRRERGEYETRSYLLHDLLHYAVEAEAGLAGGFWGSLAAGRTLAELSPASMKQAEDRAAAMVATGGRELAQVEQVVGALHGLTRGQPAADVAAGLERYDASLGRPLPAWVSRDFVARAGERLRRLAGHWRATRYRDVMALSWPPA